LLQFGAVALQTSGHCVILTLLSIILGGQLLPNTKNET
jgi:hypothetical protein